MDDAIMGPSGCEEDDREWRQIHRRRAIELARELAGMARHVADPRSPPQRRAELTRKIDSIFAELHGMSVQHMARMRLLEAIDLADRAAKRGFAETAFARQQLGQPLTAEERAFLGSGDPDAEAVIAHFASRRVTRVMAEGEQEHGKHWLFKVTASRPRRSKQASYSSVLGYFSKHFPEYAARMEPSDVDAVTRVFIRSGDGSEGGGREPGVWEAIALLMTKVGIGGVEALVIAEEWGAWTRSKTLTGGVDRRLRQKSA